VHWTPQSIGHRCVIVDFAREKTRERETPDLVDLSYNLLTTVSLAIKFLSQNSGKVITNKIEIVIKYVAAMSSKNYLFSSFSSERKEGEENKNQVVSIFIRLTIKLNFTHFFQ